MNINLSEPTKKENEMREKLRQIVIQEIKRRGLDKNQLAEKLGLLPSGADLLISRDSWSLEKGLRIAEALNMKVDLKVELNVLSK